MAKSGEKIVKEYLENKGLQVEKITEGSNKAVDFAVYLQGEAVFYLEEKTIEHISMAFKGVDPVYNAIGKHIYQATRQFKSVNPNKKLPNVLAFTNMDSGRSIEDLLTTLIGHVITPRGRIQRIEIMNKLEKEPPMIDLFLWFDQNQLAGHIWDEENTPHEDRLTEILRLE